MLSCILYFRVGNVGLECLCVECVTLTTDDGWCTIKLYHVGQFVCDSVCFNCAPANLRITQTERQHYDFLKIWLKKKIKLMFLSYWLLRQNG